MYREEKMEEEKENKVEITGEEKAKALLMIQGDVLNQLLQFESFQQFLAMRYEITPRIDDDNKQVGLKVREYSQEEQVNIVKKSLEQLKKGEELILATPDDMKKLPKIDFPRRGYKRRNR